MSNQNSVHIRPAVDTDLKHIDEIYRAGLATEIQGQPEMEKNFVRMPSGTTYIAELDNRPVAFVNFRGQDLRFIYVHPDVHKQGIGRKLMELAINEIGGDARLLVYVYNTKAQALYKSFGFQEVPNAIANDLIVYQRKSS